MVYLYIQRSFTSISMHLQRYEYITNIFYKALIINDWKRTSLEYAIHQKWSALLINFFFSLIGHHGFSELRGSLFAIKILLKARRNISENGRFRKSV